MGRLPRSLFTTEEVWVHPDGKHAYLGTGSGGDRMYAIENGPSGFDPANPAYFPKQRFLMLMRNARLAELRTAFDEASHTLIVRSENREVARAAIETILTLDEIEEWNS